MVAQQALVAYMRNVTAHFVFPTTLAAAVIGALPQKEAVTIYFEVLKAVEDAGLDFTAAVAASKPVDMPKDPIRRTRGRRLLALIPRLVELGLKASK
jgi:hypothetical protein